MEDVSRLMHPTVALLAAGLDGAGRVFPSSGSSDSFRIVEIAVDSVLRAVRDMVMLPARLLRGREHSRNRFDCRWRAKLNLDVMRLLDERQGHR
jgi:hypothetical protein